jgi:hypothetical protein
MSEKSSGLWHWQPRHELLLKARAAPQICIDDLSPGKALQPDKAATTLLHYAVNLAHYLQRT